ncbi:unnamed protein product [Arabidopsis lyrata]|nr:unnamed protein product [Arabidopsis lyrata]
MVLLVLELMNWRRKHKKRVALQRQAAVTVEAAEDNARRFESDVYDYQHNMGLLLLEKNELMSKYEEIKASVDI